MGRYSLTKKRKDVEREVAAKLRVNLDGVDAFERYNVAPTQEVPAIVQDRHGRRVELLRWGLVPHWASDAKAAFTMINARAETLGAKPTYSRLVERASRRCLVVADGFYEWLKPEDPKGLRLPVRFALAGGASFCFAGLWANRSCTVITTHANELVAPAHDRMPVILADPAAWEAWLDPSLDGEAVAPLLAPLAADLMSAAPANPALNSADYDEPDCLQPPNRQT
jgi:putative SOS response-associated peptidase YedK